MKKLIGLFLCAALLGSTFVGCASSGGTPSATSGGTAASSAAGIKASDIKAVLILPGSINDQGWNASNCAGAKACNAKLGTKIEYVENVKEADFEATFTQYAERGYNLVMAAGNQFDKACEAVAPKFKDVTFTVVNGTDSKSSNMAPIFVKEYEGAYLAGIIAGSVTKNGKIATMGGAVEQSDGPAAGHLRSRRGTDGQGERLEQREGHPLLSGQLGRPFGWQAGNKADDQ